MKRFSVAIVVRWQNRSPHWCCRDSSWEGLEHYIFEAPTEEMAIALGAERARQRRLKEEPTVGGITVVATSALEIREANENENRPTG